MSGRHLEVGRPHLQAHQGTGPYSVLSTFIIFLHEAFVIFFSRTFVTVIFVAGDVAGGVGSTVACESALRSAGTLLSPVRAPLPAPWPDGGPESLRSPCCGLAIYKNSKTQTRR
ncbi:hypothetical protein PoB_004651400 [Plakobranchus ocellatus]|uniref:Uncharacterized protein n=1 Tax=Plakobranchus ocellatus TaxID=259542 RepID=A0AAV4BNX6_9GAST|nr:hypothetical protein PoB_004651400 [Plakobranchus ocellatus]